MSLGNFLLKGSGVPVVDHPGIITAWQRNDKLCIDALAVSENRVSAADGVVDHLFLCSTGMRYAGGTLYGIGIYPLGNRFALCMAFVF